MARIEYSAQVNEIKGSIGGTTFQRNKSGTITKLKNIVVGSPNVKQNETRTLFNEVVRAWSELSIANKALWNTFAGLHSRFNYWNEEKNLSGFNWHQSLNINRILSGEALLSAPPTYITPPTVPAFTVTLDDEDYMLVWSPQYVHTNIRLFIFSTPPIRSVSMLNRKDLRLIHIEESNDSEQITLETHWATYFDRTYPPEAVTGGFNILTSVAAVDETTGIAGIFTSLLQSYTNNS